jgi:hypothetical protein
MELANYIETAMKSILKNPIYEVLSEIKITKILKQSNFVKREVGYPPFQIILHFLYMLIMQKRQSTFIKIVIMHLVKMRIIDLLKTVVITGESFCY